MAATRQMYIANCLLAIAPMDLYVVTMRLCGRGRYSLVNVPDDEKIAL